MLYNGLKDLLNDSAERPNDHTTLVEKTMPHHALPYPQSNSWLKAIATHYGLIMLGGGQNKEILVTAYEEISADLALQQKIELSQDTGDQPNHFGSGLIGLLSYDDYSDSQSPKPSRFLRVYGSACIDHQNKSASFFSEDSHPPGAVKISIDQLTDLLNSTNPTQQDPPIGLKLSPKESDHSYLEKVKGCLEDISNGRFYQINLLRFFSMETEINRNELIELFTRRAGPFGSFLELPDLMVASFSPERFVKISRNTGSESGSLQIDTFPIKGTAPRCKDHKSDHQSAQDLLKSTKDQAELHMIVDLMRNDLNQICERNSVIVEDPGSLQSFVNVHHLIAHVRGTLLPSLTLGELFSLICPAGSITGAPKKEVMTAIREKEGRDRGYFMGHVFYWDPRIGLDSSILIRTLTKVGANPYEFAAGSGIVIHSDPALELNEITAKCRVVSEAF